MGGWVTHHQCPLCGHKDLSGTHHIRYWTQKPFTHRLNITCGGKVKGKRVTKSIPTPDEAVRVMDPTSHPRYKQYAHQVLHGRQAEEECRDNGEQALTLEQIDKLARKRKTPNVGSVHATVSKSHDIVILQWNTDKYLAAHVNKTGVVEDRLGRVFQHAKSVQADVICLQETEGISLSHKAMDTKGWTYLSHGKVAILINKHTAKNLFDPASVW